MRLTIDNVEYRIPENWDGVTLGQFCDILTLEQDDKLTPMNLQVKRIALLSGNDKLEQVLRTLDYTSELMPILEHYTWMNVSPDFKNFEQVSEFEFDGEKYRIKKDFHKLTADEFIMIEEVNKSAKFDIHYFEAVFGVIFRKIDSDGNELPISLEMMLETISKFRNRVKASDVMGVLSFFLHTAKNSSKITQSSSQRVKIQMESTQSKKKTQTQKKKK